MPSNLISVVVYLVILGVILYLLELLPIDGMIKTIIRVVVILVILLWLLSLLLGVPIPSLRTP
jgi:hypothetical protein